MNREHSMRIGSLISSRRLMADPVRARSLPDRSGAALFWALWSSSVLAGVLLRYVNFHAARSLWLDEAMLALNVAARSFPELLRPLDYNQIAPPLFLWIERLAVLAGGTSEKALRAWPTDVASEATSLGYRWGTTRPELTPLECTEGGAQIDVDI